MTSLASTTPSPLISFSSSSSENHPPLPNKPPPNSLRLLLFCSRRDERRLVTPKRDDGESLVADATIFHATPPIGTPSSCNSSIFNSVISSGDISDPSHGLQNLWPSSSWYMPFGHASHRSLLPNGWKNPFGHSWQDASFGVNEKEPGGHSPQEFVSPSAMT